MKHVPAKWLFIIHYCLLAVDLALVGGFVFQQLTHASPAAVAYWGITPGILTLASIHFIYGVIVYPLVRRKNLWFATLFSFMLMDILFATLLETSGNTNYVYRTGLIGVIGASASLGPYLLVVELAVMGLLNIFTVMGVLRPSGLSPLNEFILY